MRNTSYARQQPQKGTAIYVTFSEKKGHLLFELFSQTLSHIVLFAYREVLQEATGFSPFELVYGRESQSFHILRVTLFRRPP